MPDRLKDRNSQIPFGMKFYLPEANWNSSPGSFDSIVNALMRVIQGNPRLAAKHNWPTAKADVEEWVDRYNAALCRHFGWGDYIYSDAGNPAPKDLPPHQPRPGRVARLVAGAAIMAEMFGPTAQPVARDLAESRAATCANGCPKNDKGDWTRFFTVPMQSVVVRTLESVKGMNLTTGRDSELGVCTACDCPLKAKVWIPLSFIRARMPPAQVDQLWENCWIRKERG